ncbi:hypothetical protein [Geomesophilobacter sediminis]|uniref:AXH domain-containing protein n=1 Tax=Geomesophilobacter sediminis TaxID=2798584 RepID=A0A8J7S732_9BACT|nr:hypothetical protein [Geomesophilobacter sediminis]MBJ6726727.1 hypothetical protein [Geomesophilobacter sediminis]
MQCPVCKNHDSESIELRSGGFNVGLRECRTCGSAWSVNHGAVAIVNDSQAATFLEALSECVEGDQFFAAA